MCSIYCLKVMLSVRWQVQFLLVGVVYCSHSPGNSFWLIYFLIKRSVVNKIVIKYETGNN